MHSYSVSGNDCEFLVTIFSSVKKEENQDILPLDICLYFLIY